MAEVTGIDSSSLNAPEQNPGSVNALTGITSLVDILQKSHDVQESILKVVQNGPSKITDTDVSESIKNTALNDNTNALLKLSDTINSATLDISVNGFDSEFFNTLMKFVGKNSGKLTGLETFSKVFESAVMRMGSLEKYGRSIEKTSQALLGAFGTFKEFGKGLMFFSAGLALLGFTLITFMEAITVEDMLTFGAIMLMLKYTGDIASKSAWDFAKVAVGIALLGLSVWAFTEVVSTELAWDFVKSLTLISAGIWIMEKMTSSAGKNYLGILKGSLSIAAIAGSIWVLNKAMADLSDVDLVLAAEMAVITFGYGVIFSGLGTQMSLILQGALSAAAIGGGLWFFSKGLNAMSTVEMSLERGLALAAITIAAAGIFALIGNPVTIGFTLAGAAAAAAIGGALWVLSKGLKSIEGVNVTEPQASQFANSITTALDAILTIGTPGNLIRLAIAVPASVAMAASSLALAGAINIISSMKILTPEKYENFAYGVESIVKAYTSLGGWSIAKAGIAAGVITLVAGASMLTALAINAFSKISASPDSVNMAVLSLDTFVSGISTSLDKNKDKFDSIGVGIQSFFGISSMVKEIADTVQAVSNLEFYDKKIVNGKVVLTGVRKFTSADFANVGSSIGQMLNALTDPLAKIGSSNDTYSIGGFEVTNPFSNKVQKGVEALASIGSVFNPITTMLRTFSDKSIDAKFINTFNFNLATLLSGISKAFSQDGLEIDDDVVEQIALASGSLNKIIARISAPNFQKGVGSFKVMSKDLASVKNSLNGIDLAKLTKFNMMLGQLNELQKSDSMKELVKVFKEFIESFVDFVDTRNSQQATNTQPSPMMNPFMPQQIVQSKESSVPSNTKDNTVIETQNANAEEMIKQAKLLYQYLTSGQLEVKLKQF